MGNAPGIGPKLCLEQQLALEVTRRFAYNAPREQVARMMQQLHQDNMLLRQAVVEMLGGED